MENRAAEEMCLLQCLFPLQFSSHVHALAPDRKPNMTQHLLQGKPHSTLITREGEWC